MHHPKTRWKKTEICESQANQLAHDMGIHPMMAKILIKRGFTTAEQARSFLHVNADAFYDPFRLDGMRVATERIKQALKQGERIWIYGDYDADGVSSTSLMVDSFRMLEGDVDYYIPNRFTEGYGLNAEALQLAADEGVSLVITVDTGISAVEEARMAKSLGLDLIITDHHEPPPTLPEALAVINPKKPGCPYPFKMLAGVGVAFKLAHALLGRLPDGLLSLAALGTIADLVPLVGENRLIAALGLKKMNERHHVGLTALMNTAGLRDGDVTAGHVGFTLGPRINASGRLESADAAVKLLTARETDEAEQYAAELEEMNRERQQLVEQMAEEAIAQVEAEEGRHQYAIVIGHPGWNAGVIGIVASRLVERFYRPTVVLSLDEETGLAKGSARSIDGFDLFAALSTMKDLLPHFGGHKAAAGLTVSMNDIEQLRRRLNDVAAAWLTADDYIPITHLDLMCSVEDITVDWVGQLSLLEPYGIGNPTPRFHITNSRIKEYRRIGRDRSHLKLSLAGDDSSDPLQAVAFRMAELADEITPGAQVEAVGELQINEWNGHRLPQMIVREMAVPHMQVFDWRGRHMKTANWHTLASRNTLFVCFAETPFMQAQDLLKGSDADLMLWEGEQTDQFRLQAFRELVLVDIPLDWTRYCQLLNAVDQLERVYVLGKTEEAAVAVPKRNDFKHVYAWLYKRKRYHVSEEAASWSKKTKLSPAMIRFVMDVFMELGFAEYREEEVHIVPNPPRRSLSESTLLQTRQKQFDLYQRFYYASARDLEQDIIKVRSVERSHLSGGIQHGFQKEDSSHHGLSPTGSAF